MEIGNKLKIKSYSVLADGYGFILENGTTLMLSGNQLNCLSGLRRVYRGSAYLARTSEQDYIVTS